jgi:hypothetical protein
VMMISSAPLRISLPALEASLLTHDLDQRSVQ